MLICPTTTSRDARLPKWKKAANAQFTGRSGGVRFLFNQYLVEDGKQRILIDAGAAGSIGETGHLPQALATLGLKPSDIDAVIVTHMHQTIWAVWFSAVRTIIRMPRSM